MRSIAAYRMNLLKRVLLVLGLASCVLFASLSGTQAHKARIHAEFDQLPLADDYESTATVEIRRAGRGEHVKIEVQGVEPNEFYTVWVRLRDVNPLTGTRSTALAPTDEIDTLWAVTPPPEDYKLCFATGSEDLINGFWTDGDGDGNVVVELDFRLTDGFYPFDRYASDFRAARLKRGVFGATLRIASHFCDHIGHGLVPGPHEGWFDWTLP